MNELDVDLDSLPANFDTYHAVAGNHPGAVKHAWGFTVCGGNAGYRSVLGNGFCLSAVNRISFQAKKTKYAPP